MAKVTSVDGNTVEVSDERAAVLIGRGWKPADTPKPSTKKSAATKASGKADTEAKD